MSHPKSKLTDWAALLQHEMSKTTREPEGSGWEVFEDILKRTGWGRSRANTCMRSAIASGSIERFDGTRVREDGKLKRAIWYRPIK